MIKSLKFPISIFLFLAFAANMAAQGNINRANKQYELYDFKEAVKLYHKVLEGDAENVEALSKLADCYFQMNQLSEAQKWFEKAIKKRGFEYAYMLNYAHTLMGLGDYAKARQWFLLYGEGFPNIGEHYGNACEIAATRVNEAAAYQVALSPVSSAKSDFSPAFWGDKTVFASNNRRRSGESTDEAQKNLLFSSNRNSNQELESPSYLFFSKLTSHYGVGPLSFSKDGKWVAYTKNTFQDGVRQIPSAGSELSLYIAEVKDDGQWKSIIPFPFNGSGYSTGFPSLSADGKTLHFSSNRPDGLGGFDIYVSHKVNGEWSFPKNLGAPVNSPGDEITPFQTGNNLYFSSNWHQGFGGFDIFRAEQGVTNWAKVFHQGTGVNSSRDDYGFIFDESQSIGYFTSNRTGGKGMEDIYRVSKSTEKYLVTVIDEATKAPIQGATIDFTSCGQKMVETNSDGQYGFQISGGFNCAVVVGKDGYANKIATINSKGLKAINRVEVILKSTSNKETFVGRVIQAGTPNAIEDVYITASNMRNGQTTKVQSDVSGYYQLLLELNTTYKVKFSKVGFAEVERTVNTGKGIDKSILDVTSLISSSTSIPTSSGTTVDTGTTPEPTFPPVVTVPPTTTPPTPPIIETPPSPQVPASNPANTSLIEGYSVQIAALPANSTFETSKYAKAGQLGRLYTKDGGSFKRVRVGVFRTKSEANAAQNKLTNLGYKGAYVVNESGANFGTTSSTNPSLPPVITSTPQTPPSNTTTPKPAVSSAQYFVRLGAFRNPKAFDGKGMSVYGKFVEYAKGDFTIIMVESGSKIGRARVIREKAKAKGFEGAYIVEKKNGKYVKA